MARPVAPDPRAGLAAGEVYQDDDGVLWSIMLNYTNISFGTYGNNKFYMLQLIKSGDTFKVFRKWGRVGAVNPQTALEHYAGSLEKARDSFQKKFLLKSGNEWPLEGPFEAVAGKYVLVELDDQQPEEQEQESDEEDKPTQPSKLPEPVQDVVKLICDGNLIAQEMAAMNLDLKRMPLGRLSQTQISRGYSLLQEMSNVLQQINELSNAADASAEAADDKRGATMRSRGTRRSTRSIPKNATAVRKLKSELKHLSSEFYTLIPHDFGRSLPPTIDTMDEVKLKIDLLEVLADVEISQKLEHEKNKAKKANEVPIHPLDAQYNMLNVKMEPVAETDDEFKIIQRYVETSHAPTHVQYKLRISSLLKIARPSEDERDPILQSLGNHKLLWHGSRLSNVVSILSKGLRVAPPEAPSNGYMFGKGIYFADSVSKSANYCWTTPEQPKGVLLLAEVALGRTYAALGAEDLSFEKITKEKASDSLHGLGRMAAPEEAHETMQDGVVVPIGEFEPTNAVDGELLYNEFVVYRAEQVKLRYLVSLDFDYDV